MEKALLPLEMPSAEEKVNKNLKVILIGVGNMGSAMAGAWLDSDIVASENLTLIDRETRILSGVSVCSDYNLVHEKILA